MMSKKELETEKAMAILAGKYYPTCIVCGEALPLEQRSWIYAHEGQKGFAPCWETMGHVQSREMVYSDRHMWHPGDPGVAIPSPAAIKRALTVAKMLKKKYRGMNRSSSRHV